MCVCEEKGGKEGGGGEGGGGVLGEIQNKKIAIDDIFVSLRTWRHSRVPRCTAHTALANGSSW